MREPFWGPNAKPLLIQIVVGTTIALAAYWLLGDFAYSIGYNFSCTYITGSCL